MKTFFSVKISHACSLLSLLMLGLGLSPTATLAQTKLYSPVPLQTGKQISDRLSEDDIPTGQGGFARDYRVTLTAGDQVVVDLISDNFDTIVALMAMDGTTVAENDDGPDGSTNSLLFTRINKAGTYIVRVRGFGESASGPFKLKVTRLKPI